MNKFLLVLLWFALGVGIVLEFFLIKRFISGDYPHTIPYYLINLFIVIVLVIDIPMIRYQLKIVRGEKND